MNDELIDLFLQPWNIGRERGRRIIGHALRHLSSPRSERPAMDIDGCPLPIMQIANGIARIPLVGKLMLNVPQWAKEFGINATDGYDIEEEVARALADPSVEFIGLDVHSPGGLSIAGETLFDCFENAARQKPLMAFTRGMMCSSAYQAAAPAQAIYCNKVAELGSIGTYCVLLDDSRMFKEMGVDITVLRSGKFKGQGEDGFSPEEVARIDALVQAHGATFRAGVQKHRTSIAPEDLEGQSFMASEAIAKGFAHGLAANFNEAAARFRALL